MSAIHLEETYPQPIAVVWRALTDPEVIPRWTSTGAGGRPVGFSAEAGTRFQFIGKPKPGWDGVVDCVVLEATEPSVFRFSWQDTGSGDVTEVAFRLEPTAEGGTRLGYDHTGFTGVGGFFMALLLGRVRRTMLRTGLPPVLADLA